MIANGNATTMYEMLEPVQCLCGAEIVVKISENQLFINCGDPEWKKLAHENGAGQHLYRRASMDHHEGL